MELYLIWFQERSLLERQSNPKTVKEFSMSKIVIISLDALRSEDLLFMKTLPHFSKILASASVAEKVTSIYPSVTYPCHASIISGCYPKKHGVYNNYLFQPGSSTPHWFWYFNQIKAKTLLHIAKEKKLKTSAIFWPVTVGYKTPFNIPEVLPHGIYKSQAAASIRFSSTFFLLKCFAKHGSLLKGISQPNLDDFALQCSIEALKKNVEVALFHFTDLDAMRHKHGTTSPEAYDALKRHDKRLGDILTQIDTNGDLQNTNIFILGDHSFRDVKYKININSYLRDQGFITLDGDGNVSDYRAYAHKCDGSCQVFFKSEDDKNSLIKKLDKNELRKLGINDVITGNRLSEFGVHPSISMMLEAATDHIFTWDYSAVNYVEPLPKSHSVAQHGFSPYPDDYQTLFIAWGPDIKEKVYIPKISLVDIAPTIAKVMKSTLEDADGSVIKDFLKGDINGDN